MSKVDLQNWILNNNGFITRYKYVLKKSVNNQFLSLKEVNCSSEELDWSYMLICASLLAQSDKEEHQKVALRIAQFCIENIETSVVEKDAAAVILDMLGNKPAILLAEKRGFLSEGFYNRLPFSLSQDTIKRDVHNTLHLFEDIFLSVNSFQREFWDQVNTNKWLSVSAPTSAGKSFIIEQWIVYFLHYNFRSTIVYIVPTRALISQVQSELEFVFNTYQLKDYNISILPLKTVIKPDIPNVLVYTQERFQILLSNSSPKIDLLIIDEAHKIGDNYRGVLLQHAVDAAVDLNPECKVVYASPMTSNPEILIEDSPNDADKYSFTSECITVNQNLIWISQKPRKPHEWLLTLVTDNNKMEIGEIHLEDSPNTHSKKKAFIAYAISGLTSGNVIYANGAAEAEEIAKLLFGLIPDEETIENEIEIINLIDLVKKVIHKEYLLSMYLIKGIAFHYGNIPLIIRNEIEKLFNKGIIKYLICTSTLIEGVNLPCRNLFIHGPQKGRGNPMNETDFWNLAGRAGRWGKEFQGNIFCIEATKTNVWRNGAPTNRKKYPIIKTADEVIRNGDFINYLESVADLIQPPSNNNFDYVLSYLACSLIRNGTIKKTVWINRFGKEKINKIENLVSSMLDKLSISSEIILNNPGVSPFTMDKLYNYFVKRTFEDNKPIYELLPVSPESDDAFEVYISILCRINKYFDNVLGFGIRVNT